MHNSMKLLHQAFAVFIFCIAITFLLIEYRTYSSTLSQVKEIVRNDDIVYEQYIDIKDNTVTKGEIITMLFHQLEYDIQIDDLLISKIEDVKENISSYAIPYEKYTKSYAYDSKGNITRIIFTRI